MVTLALLDDYPEPALGHHPDLLLGLGEAAQRLAQRDGPTRLFCPPSFVADGTVPDGAVHHPFRRVGTRAALHRERMAAVLGEARSHGVDLLINLFFDENHHSFPAARHGVGVCHVLHRPAELMDSAQVGRGDPCLAAYLDRIAPDDTFIVHTAADHATVLRWLPRERVLRLGWPAASLAELTARFAAAGPAAGQEPYVLLVGDLRREKGVHDLLLALSAGGPLLRIVGQQPEGVAPELRRRYPDTRIEMEPGWVSRARLAAAISGAAVVVFPYLEEFGQHGGASAALAQVLTFGKPVVASTVLADQLPASAAHLLVEPGDRPGLRQALEQAVRNSLALHQAALSTLDQVRREHSYDLHLEQIVRAATR